MSLRRDSAGTRRLFSESGLITLAQVAMALCAVVVSATVLRTVPAHFGAAFVAGYALESIALAGLRGYLVAAPVLKHEGKSLCGADVTYVRMLLVWGCIGWIVPTVALGLLMGVGWRFAVAVSLWAAATLFCDVARQSAVAFGSTVTALTIMLVANGFVVSTAVITRAQPTLFLVVVAAVLACAGALLLSLITKASSNGTCKRHFWAGSHQKFARSMGRESLTNATIISGAIVSLAWLSPSAAVAYQIATQASVGPAAILANGLSVPVLRRIGEEVRAGGSGWRYLAIWILVILTTLVIAVVFAFRLDPLMTVIFGGPQWASALAILVPLAGHQAVWTCAYAWVTKYRFMIPAKVVASRTAMNLALMQVAVLVCVGYTGGGGYGLGLVLGAAVGAVTWGGTFARWHVKYEPS